jgi:hypothetical protein
MGATAAKSGHLHIFDFGAGAAKPKPMKSIATAEGAHHVAFTLDGRYAYVQNARLSLPGMSNGSSITVIDLKRKNAIASVDTLKNTGYDPNSKAPPPRWSEVAGH